MPRRIYSDLELFNEIRRLTEVLGKAPTIREMNQRGRFAHMTYMNRFKSWDRVLELSGVKHLKVRRSPKYTKDVLLQFLQDYYSKYKRFPRVSDLGKRNNAPSYFAFERSFGGMRKARSLIGFTATGNYNISDEMLVEDLLDLYHRIGRPPKHIEIDNGCRFSYRTYLRRFGSMRRIREIATRSGHLRILNTGSAKR